MFRTALKAAAAVGGGGCVGLAVSLYGASEPTRNDASKKKEKARVVVIGGGPAGISVSSQLANSNPNVDVVVVDPSTVHYYQPMWTLVGAGLKRKEQSARPMSDMISRKVQWVPQAAARVTPAKNEVVLSDGQALAYDYLVVAPGMVVDWDAIPGVKDSVGKDGSGVVSIYDYHHSEATYNAISAFKGGKAFFTVPRMPIKCAGAPQKIMWMFEERMRDLGLRGNTSVTLVTSTPGIFGVPKYAAMLMKEKDARGVALTVTTDLVKVDTATKTATFKNSTTGAQTTEKYDLLHVVPPMSAPAFIAQSGLAGAGGWMDVNKYTLQHTKYPNVFGLGDCTNTPNGKTAAAITSQAPVVVHNLQRAMNNQPLNGYYHGYGSCPLMVNTFRVILAEFGYDGVIMETFPYQMGAVQERIFAFIKREVFPFCYWHFMPRGMWYGKDTFFKPDVTKNPPVVPGTQVCG